MAAIELSRTTTK